MKTRNLLLVLLLFTFLVRLIPTTFDTIPGNDGYLHQDLAKAVKEYGLFSKNLGSLMGLKPYSYPPGFHLLVANLMRVIPLDLITLLLPAVFGVTSVLAVYLIVKEFYDEKLALVAAFIFACTPSFVQRSIFFMPEIIGVTLFLVTLLLIHKFTRTSELKYLVFSIIVFFVYVFTHRGWIFLLFVLAIYFLILHKDAFLKKNIVIIIALIALVLSPFWFELVTNLMMRLPREPVTALGFLKWFGPLNLLAIPGAIITYKRRGKTDSFIFLWALVFCLLGSLSFRFRDPYAAIPVAILASIGLYGYAKPMVEKKFRTRGTSLLLVIIVFIGIAQSIVTVQYFVDRTGARELEGYLWLKNNTPEDTVVLSWKQQGYRINSISQRRDVIIWKKFYEGFFEEPPSTEEVKQSYMEVGTIFRSVNKTNVTMLLEKYNISYVLIDYKMETEISALEYGLLEYINTEDRFKKVFENEKIKIYEYNRRKY